MSNVIPFPKRGERVSYGKPTQPRRKNTKKRPETNKKKKVNGQKPRKQISKKPRKSNARKGGKRRHQWGVILLVVLVLIGLWAVFHKNGVEVFIGEKSYGLLKEKAVTAEYLQDTLTAQLESENKTKIKINETIKVVPLRITSSRKGQICTLDYLLPKLRKAITFQVGASVIQVNGRKATVLANETDAKEVLEALKVQYVPEGAKMEVTFVDKVEIVSEFVDSNEVVSKEEAIAILQKGTKAQKTYTVKSGDGLYNIAKNAEMEVEELFAINQGLTIETSLYVGQVINVMVIKPFVSVKTVETQVMTDVEPKTYEYQKDATKNKGYQKVLQQGRAGQKESTVQITRINGFVEEEKEISKKVTIEPVVEIILQGTK